MTRNKQDGGPVYPCKTYTQSGHPNGESMGMTLRDWFAGQVAAEMIRLTQHHDGGWDPISVAAGCYDMADAMIAERDKQ